ncbi:MAG: hypothetical protein H0V44_15065 [Planctomycetes bacterium]|nr:hypothetical protein [Planctomycetota bacterium]
MHRRGSLRIALTRGAGTTQLACWDSRGSQLRWHARWEADPTVPSRALALSDGYAVVSEGARLVLVDGLTGEQLMRTQTPGVDALASQALVLSPWRMALLHPLDVNRELVLFDGVPTSGFTRASPTTTMLRIVLPSPARWMVPTGSGDALVKLSDGRLFLYPGARPTTLPPALDGDIPPISTPEGLVRAGRLFPWSSP